MKLLRDNIGWIATTAMAAATLVTLAVNTDEKVVYSAIILLVASVALLATALKSKFDRSDRQSVLRTFFSNDLLPNKAKAFLEFKTEIVIVEDGTVQSFHQSLKKEVAPEGRNAGTLNIIPFTCDPSDVEKQKDNLRSLLKGVEAVIVVRTKELEGSAWVYDVIQEWAVRNSHAPCLVVDRLTDEERALLRGQGKLSPIPERYFFIDDDPKSLPWRLLKRADERAFAWRNQASFNRLAGLIFIALFLLASAAVLRVNFGRRDEHERTLMSQRDLYEEALGGQRRVYEQLLKGLFYDYKGDADYQTLHGIFMGAARQTKEQYERTVARTADENLHVSYWYVYDGVYYQLGTTEEVKHEKKGWGLTSWKDDEPSIVGCAFAKGNRAVQWPKRGEHKRQLLITPFNEGAPVDYQDRRCQYGTQEWRTLTSVVCTSYNPDKDDDRHTVGVCAFTSTAANDLASLPIDFLKDRTIDFQEFVTRYIDEGKLVPPAGLLNEAAHKQRGPGAARTDPR